MDRNYIAAPAVAVAGGAVGCALRAWGLRTAFEPETGLPIPGMPATWALILLSIAMAAVLLVLTNWVKLTKKWHPIVFIGLSAAVGVVFRFGGV